MLAFPSEDMKLEMFPPGQAATRIIPRPIMGEIQPVSRMASRQVNAGSRISWHIAPRITDLGFLKTSMKIPGLIPSATPYITNARIILMVFMPPAFRFTSMLSMVAAISGFILSYSLSVSNIRIFLQILIYSLKREGFYTHKLT